MTEFLLVISGCPQGPLPSEVYGSPQGIIDGLLKNISHMTRMWVAQSGPRFLWIINLNSSKTLLRSCNLKKKRMTAVKPTWHIPAAYFSYCIYGWQATLTTAV